MNENKLRELFEKGSITEIRQAVDNYPEIKERVLAWAVELCDEQNNAGGI